MNTTGRRHPWGVAAVGLVLAAVGAVGWWVQSPGDHPAASPAGGTASASAAAPPGGPAPEPVVARRAPAGSPHRVVIPALHVDAPVVPVHAPGRTLVPPSDPTQLGWWVDGARPGARRGSALIAGHTVHTGGGALDDLATLHRGDPVVVRTDHGPIRYVVRQVRVYAKGRIAADARRLFSQSVPGRLVLLTCADWDGARYLSNVVVTATPGPAR